MSRYMHIPRGIGYKYINYLSHNFSNIFNRNVAYRLITGITVIHVTTNHIIGITLTSGPSMGPLIDPNGTLVIYTLNTFNKILNGFTSRCYKRGDVIIAKSTQNSQKRICKRIIGLEGDYIGDKIIPINHIWIEGDSRTNSFDSRHYGPIPLNNVLGKVKVIISTDSMKII